MLYYNSNNKAIRVTDWNSAFSYYVLVFVKPTVFLFEYPKGAPES